MGARPRLVGYLRLSREASISIRQMMMTMMPATVVAGMLSIEFLLGAFARNATFDGCLVQNGVSRKFGTKVSAQGLDFLYT